MRFHNFDSNDRAGESDFEQVSPFMPSNTFRMLICGPSGCGKTNTLLSSLL